MATEQIPVESNPRRLLILIVGVEVATVAFLSMALYFALRQVSGRVILLLPLDLDPSPKPSCGIGDAPGLRRSTDISAANMADMVVPTLLVIPCDKDFVAIEHTGPSAIRDAVKDAVAHRPSETGHRSAVGARLS